MSYPITPPVAPMLAKAVHELPVGEDYSYEPKWDGFRCLVFRDGNDVLLTSRNERPLNRYFPEVVEAIGSAKKSRYVLDGELVIASANGLDFDALLQRIHPAASRVARLSGESPASYVAFDLLADDADRRDEALSRRQELLFEVFSSGMPGCHLTPSTTEPALALDWLARFEGAGLDGVVAKSLTASYRPGERVMQKLKHERSADCVVGGLRLQSDGRSVASLLLGLYDGAGVLQHVGVTASFNAKARRELADVLLARRLEPGAPHPWLEDGGHRRPGTPSRWNAGKDLSFVALPPEQVCEVAYDHLQGDRFRHSTTFLRWRPDRDPASCTYDQLETVVPYELEEVFR